MVFQPSKQFYFSPEQAVGMKPDEYLIPIEEKVSLHAWRFKSKQARKGVVIQFHGNAENMSSHYVSVAWLLNHGYDLVTFDYRGYGQSSGVPSFPEVVNDSLKVLEFVEKLYAEDHTKIIVYGQSLGSVIAANTVRYSKTKIDQVVFEGAIYSLNQVSANVLSRHWLTWLFQPMGHVLISHKYNFKKIAKKFPDIPVLLLHSKQDPIVPYRQSERIYEKLRTQDKCLILAQEAQHTNIASIDKGKYRTEIIDFIERKKCD